MRHLDFLPALTQMLARRRGSWVYYIVDGGDRVPTISEIVRFRHRGSISRGDSSCVAKVAKGGSSGHFKEHLAVASKDTAFLKVI